MKTPLLEVKNISHAYNGRLLLSNVNWTIRPGEHWAVLGPNGAGKTTLLKMVCGYVWPNNGGEILRKGESHADLGVLRKGIGWVTSALVAEIPRGESVLETVLSGRFAQFGLWMLPGAELSSKDREVAECHLSDLGCSHLASRRFGTLSQGEQQKVLICRALMAEPYLLILDEPCAGLDAGGREEFLVALQVLGEKAERPGLIFVTHHPEEILPIFSKGLILKEGRIKEKGSIKEIFKGGIMHELYGVDLDLVLRKGRYWPIPPA
jgi:iron complex transport system ATP-binding protein